MSSLVSCPSTKVLENLSYCHRLFSVRYSARTRC